MSAMTCFDVALALSSEAGRVAVRVAKRLLKHGRVGKEHDAGSNEM